MLRIFSFLPLSELSKAAVLGTVDLYFHKVWIQGGGGIDNEKSKQTKQNKNTLAAYLSRVL